MPPVVEGDDPFRVLQGTSMAAPHVAGVAAMILSTNPTLTSADVEGILKETSVNDVLIDIPADSPNRLLQIPLPEGSWLRSGFLAHLKHSSISGTSVGVDRKESTPGFERLT